MKSYIAFLLLIVSFSANVFAQADKEIFAKEVNVTALRTYGQEYLPIEDGLQYVYETSLGEADLDVTKDGDSYKLAFSTSTLEYSQTVKINNNGIMLERTENEMLFCGNTINYTKPLTRIPLPLTEGQMWSGSARQIHDDDTSDVKISGTMLGTESVVTEAGTFECIIIEIKITDGKKTDTIKEWLAKDIGLIKSEAQIESGGFCGFVQSVLGLKKVDFILKEIKG